MSRHRTTSQEDDEKFALSVKRTTWHSRMEAQVRNRTREERSFISQKSAQTKRLKGAKISLAPIKGGEKPS